jgi:hypothetical protein
MTAYRKVLLAGTIVFTTLTGGAQAQTPKDFDGTIKMGISYGASSIELYQDYPGFPIVPDAKLKQWAAWLEKNTGVPGH